MKLKVGDKVSTGILETEILYVRDGYYILNNGALKFYEHEVKLIK